MSQQGYLAWYTNSSELDLTKLLKKLPRILGVGEITYLSRHSVVSDPDDLNWEFDEIDENVGASDLYRLYESGKVVCVHADFAKLGERIKRGIVAHIPPEIRGDFMPNRPYFTVGFHVLVDSANDEFQVSCRAEVGCWGYSTPSNGEEFDKRIVSIPEVLETTEELEAVMGPLQIACYYSF
jgi:hypothetical protein